MAEESPDSTASDGKSSLASATAGAVTALTFLVGFSLMFLGVPWFWVAFPVGFAGVVPMAVGLVEWYERRREPDSQAESDDPVATLRERYVSGEISETEFERRVEDILEGESDHAVETVPGREPPGERAPGREREAE